MPRDYASRKAPAKAHGKVSGKKRASSTRRGAGFSAGTFGAGALFGGVLTLALIYAPALVPAFVGENQAEAPAGQPTQPKLTYEFMNLLPNEEVVTDVTPFVARVDVPASDAAPAAGARSAAVPNVGAADTPSTLVADTPSAKEYLLQAASFRSRDEADAMRAELLLEGMTAAVSAVSNPAGGAWHRVVVGPFPNQAAMERTLTRLRSKDISALPIARVR